MKHFTLVALVLVTLVGCTAVFADDPCFFRSDRGLAADDTRSLPERFDSSRVLVWRQPLAPGHSTPCVYGDAIYATTFDQGKLNTVAVDRATGKVRWTRTAPAARLEAYHATGSPAAATPACDGKRLYVFFGSFGLLCYDLEGNLVWSKPMGPFQDEFGAASSPILVDGKLLINEDHDINNFLLCVDARTGETLWRTPREGFTRGYSTPVILDSLPGAGSGDSKVPAIGKANGKQVIVAGTITLKTHRAGAVLLRAALKP
jgi:outer membrane protein assembly factor BamB